MGIPRTLDLLLGSASCHTRFVGQKRKYPIRDGVIDKIPIAQFAGADKWQIVVNVEHKNGIVKRARYPVTIR